MAFCHIHLVRGYSLDVYGSNLTIPAIVEVGKKICMSIFTLDTGNMKFLGYQNFMISNLTLKKFN
jgi:hypothetical protein